MSFNEKVYDVLRKVPAGRITTYKEIALALGCRAYQAVGNALKANPDPIKVPCYKVICSDGFVGGYSGPGGKNKKINLLRKDGIEVLDDQIDLNKYLYHFK